MTEKLHSELRKEFQLERMVLFSDAVFAIAITLLIIEIKVPELTNEISERAVLSALGKLEPKFIGFIFSFFLIGMYWTIHHRLFGYLVNYSRKLLWLNLGFLFFIVLMPFSTAFYSEFSKPGTIQLITPLAFYVGNIWCIGIMNFILWGYIGNPDNGVAEGLPDVHFIQLARTRSLMVPVVFSLTIPVALFSPGLARFVPMLIPVVMKIVQKRFDKKLKKKKL
jgi:uncharacterized membrane protein